MLAKIFCFLLSILFASRAQFIIERGERDIFSNLTSCSKDTPDFCYFMNAEKSKFDPCVCRCWLNYPMFRNPDVFPRGGAQFTSKGKPGCVWHAHHRYAMPCFCPDKRQLCDEIYSRKILKVELLLECFHIRKVGRGRYSDDEQPLEFHLSKPGSLLAFADRDLSSCTGLETAVKMPEETDFTPKSGLLTAVYKPLNVIRFQWSASAEKFDGGILRGVFTGCAGAIKRAERCFIGKITGVYNGADCSVRALNGECCIFPLKYNGKVYNNCTRDGSKEAWCAVKLPFFGTKTKWRQACTDSAKVVPSTLEAVQGSLKKIKQYENITQNGTHQL